LLGERAADIAETDALARIEQGFGELFDDNGIGLDNVQRDPLSGAGADAGEFGQGGDEGGNGRGEQLLNR